MPYENIVFLHDYEDREPFRLLKDGKLREAIDYLKQWHYPGEHEIYDVAPWGSDDEVIVDDRDPKYFMSFNRALGYVGLSYKVINNENE